MGDGVRPIAVGCTLRRLAAKTAAACVKSPMRSLLALRQLGYGTVHGAEVAVHVLLKLDFSNAFNSVHQDKKLTQVSELAPELLPLCTLHTLHHPPSFAGKPLYSLLKERSKGPPRPTVVLSCYPPTNRKAHF